MRCLPAPLAMPPFRRHFTLFAEDRFFRARGARDALARPPAGAIVVLPETPARSFRELECWGYFRSFPLDPNFLSVVGRTGF